MEVKLLLRLHVDLLSTCIINHYDDILLFLLACKAIIGEVDYAIKQVDPKKTIDIGGRETRAVKYAGSETHLIEVLEDVW